MIIISLYLVIIIISFITGIFITKEINKRKENVIVVEKIVENNKKDLDIPELPIVYDNDHKNNKKLVVIDENMVMDTLYKNEDVVYLNDEVEPLFVDNKFKEIHPYKKDYEIDSVDFLNNNKNIVKNVIDIEGIYNDN